MKKKETRILAGILLAAAIPAWIAIRAPSASGPFQLFAQNISPTDESKKPARTASAAQKPAKDDFFTRTFSWTGADKKGKRVIFSLPKAQLKSELNQFGVPRGQEHSLLLQKKGFKRVGISKSLEIYMVDYREVFLHSLKLFAGYTRTLYAAIDALRTENNLMEFLVFVQTIKYQLPPFYYNNKFINSFFPPLLCLFEQFGDCDSKAVLLAVFLTCHNQNEKTALLIISSKAMKHSILLIKRSPAPGMSAVFIKGKGYYIPLETSSPGWAPGFVSQRLWDEITSGNFRFSELQ